MNLFELAELKLITENKIYTLDDVIDYAIKIREWLDKHPCIGNRIMKNQAISPQLRYKYKKQGIKV